MADMRHLWFLPIETSLNYLNDITRYHDDAKTSKKDFKLPLVIEIETDILEFIFQALKISLGRIHGQIFGKHTSIC